LALQHDERRMAILDVENLLTPISEEAPCGPNLEYDDVYASLDQASRGKPEQQYGSTIIPAEEPNWSEVRQLATQLVERTKDLRVSCLLARAMLETSGFSAFAEGLALNRGYLERYWSSVHPLLDQEDNNDPTLRVNTISLLSDQATTVRTLRMVPMVSSRMLGQFSLRDLEVAMGEVPPGLSEEAPKLSSIEAAFMECDLEQLQENAAAVGQCLEHSDAIESIVTDHVGAAQAVSLEKLRDTLRELHQVLKTKLSQRDVGQALDQADEVPVAATEGSHQAAPRLSGEIRSREDVVMALDKVCQYYLRHEPSSPLPLLLTRAKRLANKSFLEILKDLSPDVVEQVRALGGSDEADSG
jgi:type VI secretion system protein ImpA